MKFFKENSYDIVKLFIYQMGITIFSLVLYTAASAVEDAALKLKLRIILSVFATLFYFALSFWPVFCPAPLPLCQMRLIIYLIWVPLLSQWLA